MVVLAGGVVSYERGIPVPRAFPNVDLGPGLNRRLPWSGPGRATSPHTSTSRNEIRFVLIFFFFFTLVTGPRRSLSLERSDARVYEPSIRARLGTTLHFVLTCPSGTTNTNVNTTNGLLRPWFETTPGLDPLGFGEISTP